MKFLIHAIPHPDAQGLLNALVQLEQQCILWQPERKVLYDILHETKPDFLLTSKQFVQPYFTNALNKYSVKAIVIEDLALEPAADTALFSPREPDTRYRSDLLFIQYNAPSTQPEIINFDCGNFLRYLNSSKYRVKILAPQKIPLPTYLGIPTINEINIFLNSTIICLVDHVTGLYNAAATKTFCLCTFENSLFPHVATVQDLKDSVNHFYTEEKHRKSFIKKAHSYINSGHTYKDRAETLLEWVKTNSSSLTRTDFLQAANHE